MPEPLLLIVQCKQCQLWVQTDNGQHPNAADILRCGCCPLDHDHDVQAEETGIPCRPINLTLISPVQLRLGLGQPQSSIFSDDMTVRGSDAEATRQGLGEPVRVIQGEIYTRES
jgi:hypothetical protein